MKSGLHPENYRLVAFKDMSNDNIFITKSTAETKETVKVDGVEYPLVKLEISRTSHPYYTGKSKLVDTAGRIDKFKSRYANLTKKEDNKENQSSIEEEPKIKSDVDSITPETIDLKEPSEVDSKNNDEASVSDKPKDESPSDESPSEDESNSSEESPEPKK
jgi:large subunit ribosomal protein L31